MIYNQVDELVSVKMLKSENNKNLDSHQVDGKSGATITGDGVSDMIKERLENYLQFFNNIANE